MAERSFLRQWPQFYASSSLNCHGPLESSLSFFFGWSNMHRIHQICNHSCNSLIEMPRQASYSFHEINEISTHFCDAHSTFIKRADGLTDNVAGRLLVRWRNAQVRCPPIKRESISKLARTFHFFFVISSTICVAISMSKVPPHKGIRFAAFGGKKDAGIQTGDFSATFFTLLAVDESFVRYERHLTVIF